MLSVSIEMYDMYSSLQLLLFLVLLHLHLLLSIYCRVLFISSSFSFFVPSSVSSCLSTLPVLIIIYSLQESDR